MTEGTVSERWGHDVERDPVHLAAADWWVRLQDPDVTLEDILAWQDWLKEDPIHARAFSRIEELSLSLRRVRPPRLAGQSELALDHYDASVPLSEWKAPARRRVTIAIAASVALFVVALAAVSLWRLGAAVADSKTVIATAVGENRTVFLADGSKVTLGGNTRLQIAVSKQIRSIELSRGEAFFVVAKDPSRPFRVQAGDATVTAFGTEFNVQRNSDRAVVAVTEGRVLVEPVPHLMPVALLREFKPKLRSVRLSAGEQTTAGSAGIEDASKVEDLSTMTSWQTGRLAFRLQPLRYVLEDVNRYAPKPILLADESIGSLRITGTVTREGTSGWIASLELAFGLEAIDQTDHIVLRRRTSSGTGLTKGVLGDQMTEHEP